MTMIVTTTIRIIFKAFIILNFLMIDCWFFLKKTKPVLPKTSGRRFGRTGLIS